MLGNPGVILQAFLLPKRLPIRVALTCPAFAQSPLSWGQLLIGCELKQALSVGPNLVLSKDPCVSLKQGIDRPW